MVVQVYEDEMMSRFQVGDVVRFCLEHNEVYSYNVPVLGTIGVIEIQTHSFALEKMLGVKIPMSVVQWADGQKLAVFSHDISKVSASPEQVADVSDKIKKLIPYTGVTNN
tara:strand:+ start:892 stop:1221 length:330 start_codon:yes stop_codon:yes gene_type:complete